MAVIGNLQSLNYLFKKTSALEELYAYLVSAADPTSTDYARITSMEVGERKLELGHGMFAIEQSYRLKDPSDPQIAESLIYESHRKYVDFQLMVRGSEVFALGDKGDFEILTHYDEVKDFIRYYPKARTSKILLSQNELAIFHPHDVHAGGLALEGLEPASLVYKVVVKVPTELLKLKL